MGESSNDTMQMNEVEYWSARARSHLSALIVFLTLAMCFQLQAATPDMSGNWVVRIEATEVSNGTPNYVRLTLDQDGSELSGALPNGPISGSVEESGEFQIQTPWQIWTGSVQGDVFTATTTSTDLWRWPLSLSASRQKPPPSQPQILAFDPTEFHLHYSSSIPAVLHISPGDTVRTETVDALGVDANGRKRTAGGNPQTGPFYVEGAFPGDTLVVHLTRLQLNRDTATTTNTLIPNAIESHFNAQLEPLDFSYVTWNLDHDLGKATLDSPSEAMKDYSITLRPFLGAIGVAPPRGDAIRSIHAGAYGGNIDYNKLVEGTTLYLPVFHPGALLFIGDGHAAQGDGELSGNALETSLDVEFRVDVIQSTSPRMPRAENGEALMASGIDGSLEGALQSATTNLSRWLQETYSLDRYELSSVLGTAISYDIAEVVGVEYHIVARINKKLIDNIAPAEDQ